MPSKIVDIQLSHGRLRTELRRPTDGGTPELPPPENTVLAAPIQDKSTGRFVKGNQAARRKRLKAKAEGVHTLNPERCEAWLRPFVELGVKHGIDLVNRFTDPVLLPLAGATADAYIIYKGLVSLGASGDPIALREARAWLKEYKGCVRELCALAALQLEQDQKEALVESFFDVAGVPSNERD